MVQLELGLLGDVTIANVLPALAKAKLYQIGTPGMGHVSPAVIVA
jgi:hypothetical protein